MSSEPRHSRASARPGPIVQPELAGSRPRPRAVERSRAADGRNHNLPFVPSSFVGRAKDLAHVASLISESRLVTLTGPGGVGKTRLAIHVARGLATKFGDGVWWVEVAGCRDPARVSEVVAAALPRPWRELGLRSTDTVASHIGERSMLLVLDNCEHLVEACGHLVDTLLRACPHLSVLVTSREPLGVAGEHRWTVGSLSLPHPDRIGPARVKASEAGALFLQRATATCPSFALTKVTAPAVAEICRRLDGMPLAIELAASRLDSFTIPEVLAGLDGRFSILATRSRAVAARHRSWAANVQWSHDQLGPAEATLLRRLSVFADWSRGAAKEVCSGDGLEGHEVADGLEALAAKSLIVVQLSDNSVRYSMLGTVRAWARARLEDASESHAVARRHALWCLRLAKRAEDELGGSQPHPWLDHLEVEHDNLCAALEWARTSGNTDLAVRLATALASFWRTRGHLREGRDWLEWAITAPHDWPAVLRAKALRGTGLLRGMLGDITSALPLLEESSALFAEAGDHDASQCTCSSMFHMFRNPRQTLPSLREEIERCRRRGDTNKLAHFLWALGQAHFLLGELSEAQRHFEECVELGRGEADGEAMRSGLLGLGRVAVVLGDQGRAVKMFEEARARAEESADLDDVASALVLLGDLARARGDFRHARKLLDQSRRRMRGQETPVGKARGVYFSARLAESEAVAGSDNGAGELFAEALSMARGASGLGFHEARCLLGLGWAAQASGDHQDAAGHLLQALSIAQDIGDAQATAQALNRLSRLALVDGRLKESDALAIRSLGLHHAMADAAGIAASLESLAAVALCRERWEVATRLLASAQALLDHTGFARSRTDEDQHQRSVERMRTVLGDETFTGAWSEGSALSASEAVTYATRGRGERSRPASGWESLTPSERQVAILVSEGLTNPEVAKRLFVSPRTIGSHLAHVYQKLSIHTRTALVKEVTANVDAPIAHTAARK